jgi:voltage-gated potassium channel
MVNLPAAFGLGGVDVHEARHARYAGRFYIALVTGIAIAVLCQWSLESSGYLLGIGDVLISWIIWIFFFVEMIVLFGLVNHKWRFLWHNWFGVVFIFIGSPLIFKLAVIKPWLDEARPLLALYLLFPWAVYFIKSVLAKNRLTYTIVTIAVIIVFAGFMISGIDPGIKTPWDGFWWAWVTISTVGYGDYVPLSFMGRIFASLLILLGLGFFAVLTANFSALFLERDVKVVRKESKQILEILEKLQSVEADEGKIIKILDRLEKRLAGLEDKLG